jgi:hypothetical protein
MKALILKCLRKIEKYKEDGNIIPREVTELELKRDIMNIVSETMAQLEKEGTITVVGTTVNGLKLLKTQSDATQF